MSEKILDMAMKMMYHVKMKIEDTRFYYYHTPTGKYCYFSVYDPHIRSYELDVLDEFSVDILYCAKNVLREDLEGYSIWSEDNEMGYIGKPILEAFEMRECKVTYEY